ncbi:hypothetical protein DEU56DRAFT_754580 [Suillus clintonianus]|uniref:uncharacterized protein n=1 Tax=Suillus clintonianus TaxID=1904413 RepID=UPI001B87E9E8|nr:uncharacterized protein DEU56DRAFT_754580 [Suillus clintonianus]KAG2142989.1 hypothetical protein DEU56DRAFT_754580 [Suillus clintonianus]
MPTTVVVKTSPQKLIRNSGRSHSYQDSQKCKPGTGFKPSLISKATSLPASPLSGRRGEDLVTKSTLLAQHRVKDSPEVEDPENRNNLLTPVSSESESLTIDNHLSQCLGYPSSIWCEAAKSDIPVTGQCKLVLQPIADPEDEAAVDYDYINCFLLVEMPSRIHEAPCTVLKSWFDTYLASLDFNRGLVDTQVFLNADIETDTLSTIPDLTMTFNAGPPRRPLKEVIPVLAETAWSQNTNPLITKPKKQITAKPEILMVFMALIRETTKYQSPVHSSFTWKTLCKGKSLHSLESFLAFQPADVKSTDPISVADHTWLSLHPIDIKLVPGKRTARGRLFPDPHMSTVNGMINKGLTLIKQCLGSLCKEVNPQYDITQLLQSGIPFPFAWNRMWNAIDVASGVTAHKRYLQWYQKSSSRGTKRLERSDSPNNEASSSNTRARTIPDTVLSAQPGAAVASGDGAPSAEKSQSKNKNRRSKRKSKGKGKGN